MDKVFLFTLDEDLYGDKMAVCTDKLFELHVPATIFIDWKTSLSRSYIRELKAQGFDLQMHWIRYKRRKYDGLGRYLGYFFKEEASFEKQKAELEALLDKEVIGNRNHGLEWKCPFPRLSHDDFVFPWRVMAENGLLFSSSTYGFPHPFKPKDLSGVSFGLLEVPVTHFERVPSVAAALIVGLYHPHYQNWFQAAQWAKRFNYAFQTMHEFLEEAK